jgi:hypoxanthine-guanine phosphoribosyltransferase
MSNSLQDNISVGPTLSKYLERMNKSNDQLIKLAELIAKEEERAESVDPEDIFKKIDK